MNCFLVNGLIDEDGNGSPNSSNHDFNEPNFLIESIKRGDFDAEQNYSIAQINKEFEMILEEILPKKRLGELRDPNEIKYTHLIKLRVLQNAYDGSWENNGQ